MIQWTKAEDEILKEAVHERIAAGEDLSKAGLFEGIAKRYFAGTGRTAQSCRKRWRWALDVGLVHGKWQTHEDNLIAKMAHEGFGWHHIAAKLPGRSGMMVRYRCFQFGDLSPEERDDRQIGGVGKRWTPQEDNLLLMYQSKLGNDFMEIAKRMNGRTPRAVEGRLQRHRSNRI
mmetsp:Transcript_12266/g.22849  ORF Transcript_12266/g.22849 Transcript_12266/m.22849 type:complete len:174 (-) Transcript_12266:606-1127(-)